MTETVTYFENLKWSIYDWIGSISIEELTTNSDLKLPIAELCKCLAGCPA
jgi:hypothetical protein